MNPIPSHHYEDAILIAPKAQQAYFEAYRKAHPEETFDVLDIAAVEALFQYEATSEATRILQELGVKEAEVQNVLTIIKRLRYAEKNEVLRPYFLLRDGLEQAGVLRVNADPFIYFKGRKIIVRGYYDGKAIAEALQDLPNICVNYDFGLDILREEVLPSTPLSEALSLVIETRKPIYVFAPKGVTLPEPLSDFPRLEEPYAPSDGSFLLYGPMDEIFPLPENPYSDELAKAIRVPTILEAKRRLAVETRYLTLSPRLLARLDANT